MGENKRQRGCISFVKLLFIAIVILCFAFVWMDMQGQGNTHFDAIY